MTELLSTAQPTEYDATGLPVGEPGAPAQQLWWFQGQRVDSPLYLVVAPGMEEARRLLDARVARFPQNYKAGRVTDLSQLASGVWKELVPATRRMAGDDI